MSRRSTKRASILFSRGLTQYFIQTKHDIFGSKTDFSCENFDTEYLSEDPSSSIDGLKSELSFADFEFRVLKTDTGFRVNCECATRPTGHIDGMELADEEQKTNTTGDWYEQESFNLDTNSPPEDSSFKLFDKRSLSNYFEENRLKIMGSTMKLFEEKHPKRTSNIATIPDGEDNDNNLILLTQELMKAEGKFRLVDQINSFDVIFDYNNAEQENTIGSARNMLDSKNCPDHGRKINQICDDDIQTDDAQAAVYQESGTNLNVSEKKETQDKCLNLCAIS
mmetsp:Transcript_10851/g.13284  ORF Transcript_10851/g.13284 Transcript_10851/m.13284 type:complete len:280 (+) Transcript_10851:261-1100(+)|eukprot:CAMPEP_0194361104 /NCGR_PEP_ID=MMETSP0174-20130528/8635_1 /TAXON_ID=216777 /ORGANISM="Proboscia alata, Strain PI-D3" /LENGTH=279 /DNA_ID=CAMNT_0039133099 /DNA_START=262 /DNA_END=1101 /DNA_ORIENTATION=+